MREVGATKEIIREFGKSTPNRKVSSQRSQGGNTKKKDIKKQLRECCQMQELGRGFEKGLQQSLRDGGGFWVLGYESKTILHLVPSTARNARSQSHRNFGASVLAYFDSLVRN